MSDIASSIHDQEVNISPPPHHEEVEQQQRHNEKNLMVNTGGIIDNSITNSLYQYQKSENIFDELNSHEDEIRRLLYESKSAESKVSLHDKNNKKGITSADAVARAFRDEDDDECTFKPTINAKSQKLIKRDNPDQQVNDTLYLKAKERQAKEKEKAVEYKQSLSKQANSNKISANSVKIILKRIETALRSIVNSVETEESKEKINFENLGVILNRLGLFQSLEFKQLQDENTSRTNLSVNQSKVKPQRLVQEVAFHENFWKFLNSTSKDENSISDEVLLRVLMVLVEDKVSVQESASFLKEIIDLALDSIDVPRKGDGSIYDGIRQENDLWEVEKIVQEFRKLFNDKTTFMNFYASSGILPSRLTAEDKQRETFKPYVNPVSKALDQKNERGYKAQLKAGNEESPSKLKSRYDLLFEHHKLIKEKKSENVASKMEEEMANCTFKPQITPYVSKKKVSNDLSQSHLNASDISAIPHKDLSKAKRHDLLYESAKAQKEKLNAKIYDARRAEEDKELSQCTFQPRISRKPNEEAVNASSSQDLPKGYKKTIERLKAAEKAREEKKAEREHVSRGENYDKLRNSEFKPPSFLNRPKGQKQEALVYVDVNIGPGKTGRIGIHKGDDAKTLAKNFAKTYSLPAVMKESLEKLLQTYIDSYFPETEGNQEEPRETEGQTQAHAEEDEEEEDDEEEEEEEEDEEEEDDEEEEESSPERNGESPEAQK